MYGSKETACLRTRLKGAPSSCRATGDVILSAPYVAATALLQVETQTRVAKDKKIGRVEAIQTGVAHFRRYYCLSVSVCSIDI